MADSLSIANRALAQLGERPIQSFEDGSDVAVTVKAIYSTVRDSMLVAHPWNFAAKEADLAKEAPAASDGYEFSYQLPSDFLSARGLVSPYWCRRKYVIQGRSLCTDANGVRLLYTCQAPEQWFPPYFTQALVTLLAGEFSMPIREGPETMQAFLNRYYQVELPLARAYDSQQDTPNRFEDFTLINARGGVSHVMGETPD